MSSPKKEGRHENQSNEKYSYLSSTKYKHQLLNNYEAMQYEGHKNLYEKQCEEAPARKQILRNAQYSNKQFQNHFGTVHERLKKQPLRVYSKQLQNMEQSLENSSEKIQDRSYNYDSQLSFCKRKVSQNSSNAYDSKEVNQETLPHSKKLNFAEFSPYNEGKNWDKLLVDELEGQYRLVKGQLAEVEYQNQLLKQKLASYESERVHFSERLMTKDSTIVELQNCLEAHQRQKARFDSLVVEMKNEINILLTKTSILESEIDLKDAEIIKLRTEQEMFQIQGANNYRAPPQQLRRKSVDAIKGDRYRQSDQYNHGAIRKFNSRFENESKQQSPMNKRKNSVGKLLNKSLGAQRPTIAEDRYKENRERSNMDNSLQHQSSKTGLAESKHKTNSSNKHINLIWSIQNMFMKVHGRPAHDLKEVWKWLKSNAHQIQSLRALSNTIDIVMSEFNEAESQESHNMSFMQQESYRVLRKVQNIIDTASTRL